MGAATLWSLNGALIKLVYQDGHGPPGITIAFYRSLFAGLFLLPLARGKLHTLRSPRGRKGTIRIRPAATTCVIFFTLMTVCFVVANTRTEAANAIILQYTSTFWIFGLSPWLLKEKPERRELGVLMLVVTGIALIFFGNAATDMFGLINALGAGLFYALLTMMIRQLRDANSAAVTVFNNLGSAALLLPFVLVFGDMLLSGRSAILLLIMGVVQFGIPYYLYSLGLVRIPAYQAALICLAEPILVPVWTYLAVGEGVPIWTLAGGGVILIGLLLFIWSARRTQRRYGPSKSAAAVG
ncbi:MAG: DMT family transporter [Planctomycetes bacterium]|nr:DMT family transporter [Planctomycetota bacterium]